MTDPEQTQAFANELEKLINRYRCEFELTAATVVGVLQFQQFLIMTEVQNSHQEEE